MKREEQKIENTWKMEDMYSSDQAMENDLDKALKMISEYNKYKKHMDDVELKLYDGCRHELHSEINAQEVFEDIYNWIVERIG